MDNIQELRRPYVAASMTIDVPADDHARQIVRVHVGGSAI
jgi:hypothetical protein